MVQNNWEWALTLGLVFCLGMRSTNSCKWCPDSLIIKIGKNLHLWNFFKYVIMALKHSLNAMILSLFPPYLHFLYLSNISVSIPYTDSTSNHHTKIEKNSKTCEIRNTLCKLPRAKQTSPLHP